MCLKCAIHLNYLNTLQKLNEYGRIDEREYNTHITCHSKYNNKNIFIVLTDPT